MSDVLTPDFWTGLLEIVWVNVILSGDNAVVIALAARSLPARQQKVAVAWGAGAAVALRILLTLVAVRLLQFPFLKLAGAAALLWIAVKLLVPDSGGAEVRSSSSLAGAVRTILAADIVMSVDNVIAVAAVAKGSTVLLVLGLVVSIPLVVFGATLLMRLMERYPLIITLGAAVLGWTAGELAVTDPAVARWVHDNAAGLHWAAPVAGAILVLAVGKWLAARGRRAEAVAEGSAGTAAPAATPAVAQATSATAAAAAVAGAPQKVLVAVDGSEHSRRAARWAIEQARRWRQPPEIHLLNVQHPLPGTVDGNAPQAAQHQQAEGAKALQDARAAFDAAGLPYVSVVRVGDPADTIAQAVRRDGIDFVVMGSRGLGAAVGAVLGSVATRVLHAVDVPVLLVK